MVLPCAYDFPGLVCVFVYASSASLLRKWQKIQSIVGIVFDPVHDVAFAPNLGRYMYESACVCTSSNERKILVFHHPIV